MKYPYINKFDHTGHSVLHTLKDLPSGVFEHLEIASLLDVDKTVNYMQHILRELALKKYNTVLAE